MESAPSAPPTESPPSEMSLSARLVNVFAAPAEVFDYIKSRPHSVANWIVPAVLIIAAGLVFLGFIVSNDALAHQADEMAERQIEKQHMTGPPADMARRIGSMSARIGPMMGAIFGAVIAPFWSGLILWLVGAKILKGDFGYMKAVEAGGLTNMITLLDVVVKALLILALGNLFASLSLALLIKDYNHENPVHACLTLLNPIFLWALIVQSIALARLSGRPLLVSALWIFGTTIVFIATCMGIGFGMQAAFKPH